MTPGVGQHPDGIRTRAETPGGPRFAVRLCLMAAVALAAIGLWSAASSPGSGSASEARSVAATLRCPTCVAESVADSSAPLAASMRETIADQIAQGRTADQIREWFARRYGDDVLLDPAPRGAGWPLWLAPVAIAPVAAWLVIRDGRRGRRLTALVAAGVVLAGTTAWSVMGTETTAEQASRSDEPAPLAVLKQAARDAPTDVELRVALARALDYADLPGEAAEHYAVAVRLAPNDDTIVYRAAFALVRAERTDEALPLLDALLTRTPDHAEALLLRGTVAQQRGEPGAADLLRRFIEIAPDHPAADKAEDMLSTLLSNGGE